MGCRRYAQPDPLRRLAALIEVDGAGAGALAERLRLSNTWRDRLQGLAPPWPFDAQLPALLAAIIAMGMLNAAVEEVNGLPVGLTYVTGALSRFGRGLGRWMLGERRSGWRVQLRC